MEGRRFIHLIGIMLDRMENGEAAASMELGPQHLNRSGAAHGGVASSLLDTAMGAAVISAIPKEWWCATTSLSIHYMAAAGKGRLTATGRVLRRGARVAFATGEVHDQSGRRIAVAQGAWHLWPHKPGAPSTGPRPGHVTLRGTAEQIHVGKILAVGGNYAEHVTEMGGKAGRPPFFFAKPATALLPGGGTVRIPKGAGRVDHEVELVTVIGTGGREIPEERALDHVLGYAVGLDMTLREMQAEAKKAGRPWFLSKGFDTSAPVSEVAPRDEVGDPSDLEISLTVNGKRRQHARTAQMIHPVARLVASASAMVTLERGDLIFTGTPSGVGPVRPGDVLEGSIERVGALRVTIADEDAGERGGNTG